MKEDNFAKVIKKRTEESEKTYSFNEKHNPRLPADYWFQNSSEGLVLFVVFYSRACRWAKCLGCNLPSMVSQYDVSYRNIIKQCDFVFNYILDEKQKIDLAKIILSNNGSILDEETLSTSALLYFITQMNIFCPNIKVLTIESRPEYVDAAELETMHRAIQEGDTPTNLEIAIGFEAFDEEIRNNHFNKGLSLDVFEKLAKMLASYKFKLKTYFMLKPVPGLSEEEAINDIADGVIYLDKIATKYALSINMHLNPTYVAAGTPLEKAFREGNYEPPYMESVRKAILTAENKAISVFAGLFDEDLAVSGGSFIRSGDEELIEKLEAFNRTQDFSLIK